MASMQQQIEEDPQDALKRLFDQTNIIDEWKKGNWAALAEWLGDYDIRLFCQPDDNFQHIKLIKLDSSNQIQQFELVLGLIFAEYHKGLQNLLRIDEFSKDDPHYFEYLTSLSKVKEIIEHLYFEFKSTIEVQ